MSRTTHGRSTAWPDFKASHSHICASLVSSNIFHTTDQWIIMAIYAASGIFHQFFGSRNLWKIRAWGKCSASHVVTQTLWRSRCDCGHQHHILRPPRDQARKSWSRFVQAAVDSLKLLSDSSPRMHYPGMWTTVLKTNSLEDSLEFELNGTHWKP